MSLQDIKKSQKNRKCFLMYFFKIVQIQYTSPIIGFKINNPQKEFCLIANNSQICIRNKKH